MIRTGCKFYNFSNIRSEAREGKNRYQLLFVVVVAWCFHSSANFILQLLFVPFIDTMKCSRLHRNKKDFSPTSKKQTTQLLQREHLQAKAILKLVRDFCRASLRLVILLMELRLLYVPNASPPHRHNHLFYSHAHAHDSV